MACELPVVITDDPDNRIWVKDGYNGFIVTTKSPEKVAEKINVLLENETLRKEFGKRSRAIIQERNDYNREMGKMEKIYEKVIEEKI